MDVAFYIHHLNLLPHPEGGYYKETFRSPEAVKGGALPERFAGERSFSTAIYYLLEQGDFSAFHKIKSEECWHFYAGNTLLIHVLEETGIKTVRLGKDLAQGETFQYVVPANTWFAAEPTPGSRFALAGCTVAPGFDFNDFEMASATHLTNTYPAEKALIERLCRK